MSMRAAGALVAIMVISSVALGSFMDTKRKKAGKVMTDSKYMADSLKDHGTIPDEVIEGEVQKMLREAQERSKTYEMVRIDRPDDGPKRIDIKEDPPQ